MNPKDPVNLTKTDKLAEVDEELEQALARLSKSNDGIEELLAGIEAGDDEQVLEALPGEVSTECPPTEGAEASLEEVSGDDASAPDSVAPSADESPLPNPHGAD